MLHTIFTTLIHIHHHTPPNSPSLPLFLILSLHSGCSSAYLLRIMGCILGKHAAGDPAGGALDSAHSSPAPDHHPHRRPSSLTLGREPNEQSNKLRRHSSNFSHFELRRHMLDSCGPTNEYGWPTWLADVVGDAINHFSPRRASSFEKLDKVQSSKP